MRRKRRNDYTDPDPKTFREEANRNRIVSKHKLSSFEVFAKTDLEKTRLKALKRLYKESLKK